MKPTQFKPLRILIVVILILLAMQYEFGMAVNISNPPSIPPFGFSISAISDALHQAGGVALLHAILGAWLVIFSLVSLILSLRTKVRSVQIFGVLAFLSIFLAATSGLLFILSGFQDDHYSHGMATNFILTFAFSFLELYFLKPDAKVRSNR